MVDHGNFTFNENDFNLLPTYLTPTTFDCADCGQTLVTGVDFTSDPGIPETYDIGLHNEFCDILEMRCKEYSESTDMCHHCLVSKQKAIPAYRVSKQEHDFVKSCFAEQPEVSYDSDHSTSVSGVPEVNTDEYPFRMYDGLC